MQKKFLQALSFILSMIWLCLSLIPNAGVAMEWEEPFQKYYNKPVYMKALPQNWYVSGKQEKQMIETTLFEPRRQTGLYVGVWPEPNDLGTWEIVCHKTKDYIAYELKNVTTGMYLSAFKSKNNNLRTALSSDQSLSLFRFLGDETHGYLIEWPHGGWLHQNNVSLDVASVSNIPIVNTRFKFVLVSEDEHKKPTQYINPYLYINKHGYVEQDNAAIIGTGIGYIVGNVLCNIL